MNPITRRITIALAAGALVAGFAVAPASAAAPARAGSQISAPVVDPSSVAPGQSFTVSGVADCLKNEPLLTLTIDGLGLEQDFDGTAPWQVQFVAPQDAAPGDYAILVVHAECSFPVAYITIAAPATTTTTTTAPATTTTAPPAVKQAVAARPAFTG